jgi:hypothetical protein
VLGIISFIGCLCPLAGFATGIPAWVMGSKYQNGPNGSQARAGMILGIIGTVLSGINAVLGIILRVRQL